MKRNYVPIPNSYLDEMADLSDGEFGCLCRELMDYSMTGKPVEGKVGKSGLYAKRVMEVQDKFQAMFDAVDEIDGLDRNHKIKIENAAARYAIYSIIPKSNDKNLNYVLSKMQAA